MRLGKKKHEHQESIDGPPMFVELLRFLFFNVGSTVVLEALSRARL